MKFARASAKALNEPPAIMLTDLAFNLLIFFVVCASTDPESGRRQNIPSGSKDKAATAQADQNIEVTLTPSTIAINGNELRAINGNEFPAGDFSSQMATLLKGKTKPEQRMVVVKSRKDTPYSQWIRATVLIEQAGGVVAIQVDESKDAAGK
jgi:biopolymer transport protein ExbD